MDSASVDIQYMRQHIEKGIRDIFSAQLLIATERIYQVGHSRRLVQGRGRTVRGRSGALLNALENPNYKLNIIGGGLETETSLPTYIRFLDMRELGNYHIYNRQVWGILYTETLLNIKAGYRDWLEANFPAMLENIAK